MCSQGWGPLLPTLSLLKKSKAFQVLGTDSFPLLANVMVINSGSNRLHYSDSQRLFTRPWGIRPFIFKGISLATDRAAASGSSRLWGTFLYKGWGQLLCPQFAWRFRMGWPCLTFSTSARQVKNAAAPRWSGCPVTYWTAHLNSLYA